MDDHASSGWLEVWDKIGVGADLPETLTALVRLIENLLQGMRAAILLEDGEGKQLRLAIPATIPQAIRTLVAERPIPTSAESHTATDVHNEAVFVDDLSVNSLTRPASHAGRLSDVRAAWSVPLAGKSTPTLGVLVVYGATPGLPLDSQRTILSKAAQIAYVAVSRDRTERLSRERKSELQKIYDDVSDVLFSLEVRSDCEFVFTGANRRFFEATALSEHEVIGRSVAQVIPEPSLSIVIGHYQQAIRERRTIEWEEVTPYPAGQKTGLVRVSPVFGAEGICLRLIGTVTDITERKQMEERLRHSEETFRLLFESSRDAILVLTTNGRCVRANPAAVDLFNYRDESQLLALFPGRWLADAQPDGRRSDDVIGGFLRGDQHAPSLAEWICKRSDGSTFIAEATCSCMTLDDTEFVRVSIRDISDRKADQARLSRITRLYAALSQCNQAIVKCSNQERLLAEVCEIAVKFGEMRFAWIGLHDEAGGLLKPVASHGAGSEYLDGIEVSVALDKRSGQGPGGRAYREQRPIWCQDFMRDQSLAPWHVRGRSVGWQSIAALPLCCNDHPIGVFFLYSGVTNAFDEKAQLLLTEMAMDISFGLGMLQDAAERDLEHLQLRKLSQVVEQSHNLVMIADVRSHIEYVNPAFERITGYSRDEVLGKDPGILRSPATTEVMLAEIDSRLTQGEIWHGELVNTKKNGTEFISIMRISPLRARDGRISHHVTIGYDITEHRRAEWRVEYMTHFDELTGLPNRVQLRQRFNDALSTLNGTQRHLVLMFCDLDRFKNINDTVGHSMGDDVLKEVARRLQSSLGKDDVVCRLGGDEFIIMLPGCDAAGATYVAQNILSSMVPPCQVGDYEFAVTASIGIATYPENGTDLDTLFKNTDLAMYSAKQHGRGCFRFYNQEMQLHTLRTAQLAAGLRQAIARDSLEVHYQPQLSAGRIIGAEALLRWHHPTLGTVSPSEFIPVAEDSGLIFALGSWVLNHAVRQAKDWMDAQLGQIVVAVNVSPVQFLDARFFDTVARALSVSGLPPRSLEIEITEGVAMHDAELAIALLKRLHELGVRVSIDDFGTGYSSLNYLKKFQIDRLKIDQSFVRGLATDAEDRAIVSAIIGVANDFGLAVIAEGVETREQLNVLREQGCDAVQGYLFSKPLPASEFARFWRTWCDSVATGNSEGR